MRLEKQYEEQLAKRKGLTIRTLIQLVWLIISGVIMYFILTLLEDEGVINFDQLARSFDLPIDVPGWVFLGIFLVIGVIFMQFILFLGFAFASPDGRRKSGTPTLHSHNPDPLDNQHGY